MRTREVKGILEYVRESYAVNYNPTTAHYPIFDSNSNLQIMNRKNDREKMNESKNLLANSLSLWT